MKNIVFAPSPLNIFHNTFVENAEVVLNIVFLFVLKDQSDDEENVEDSASEDEFEDEPNLDWLPDPDEIYGKLIDEDSNKNSSSVKDEEENEIKR